MDSDTESEHSDLNYRSLDDFLVAVSSKDTNVRLDVYARLENYLNSEHTSLKCHDLNKFCDAILQWIHSSNYRISINGLTLIQLLIQRLTDQLRNHSIEIVSCVVDRLSDSKEQVRLASKNILIFMMASYTPMFIWEKLANSFSHKLAKVKEELLHLLDESLNKFSSSQLQLNKIVTHIVKLLSDANQAVRDKSLDTLIEIYRHVGERLRIDLRKKQIPEAKLKLVFHKFDEAARNGELKEEAKNPSSKNEPSETGISSCASLPPTSHLKQPSKMIPSSRSNMHSLAGSSRPGTAPGGVDEDTFLNAFENVPKIQIYSERDINQYMVQINECLSDANNDWEKRVDSLKRLRSLAIASTQNQYEEEFFVALKQISTSFCLQIKDLRSQIVREACISIAYLSQTIGNRLEHFCEAAMSHLVNLIQNSAKVMALSGVVAIRFIIENTHSTRLIPLITGGVNSRSKEIRRNCMEFLKQLLETWDTHHLDKHVNLITNTVKKGLSDADQEARVFARKAFWSFSNHYSTAADHLLNSLDPKTQKLLQNGSQGAFGSVKSLKDGYSSNQSTGNGFNYDFMDSQNSKTKSTLTANKNSATPSARIKRSTSAVDIKNSRSNSVISSGYGKSALNDSFQKSQNSSRIPTMNTLNTSVNKGTSRIALSQPGSRSTSPTPKYSYLTHTSGTPNYNHVNLNNSENNHDLAMTPNGYGNGLIKNNLSGSRSANTSFSKSKIPTSSRNSSRESSPGRRSNYGSERRSSLSKMGTPGRRLFGRQLTNNSDSEQALASAMSNKYGRMNRRWDDSDDASETSSICSERSFSSSIGGNRVTEDMNEAITCLSSSQWSDRRDGLVNLKNMMQCNRIFSRQELKRLSEIFTRLFADQHVKVCTLFLDILYDFIRVYKRDLKEWLYTLLTKLLTKLGVENLTSIYQKLCSCLDATRSSFDLDLQFKILIQFIKDNTGQSSNLKVKIAVLKYLQDIICLMESADFHASDDLKYAVCKIISLTAEPKSVEVRKTAQAVLVALFNLNTPEFSLLLQDLPKNIQETGSKILRNHIKTFSSENHNSSYQSYASDRNKHGNTYLNDYINGNVNDESLNSGSQFSHVVKNIQSLNINNGYDYLNHKVNLNSKKDLNIKGIDTLSKDSGVQSNGDVDSDSDGAMTSSSTTTTSSTSVLPNINFLITSLSNNCGNSITNIERIKHLKDLTDLIKTGNRPECKWNENFKNILFCLFNHLDYSTNDSNDQLALQTMMALRELLQFQYKEFENYIELTILKLIEKYKESPPNELSKLVEEVICTAARCLPPEPCARVLKPLIETAEYPKNLMAIRMMQKTIDQMNSELCNRLLPDILNCLLIAWDSTHSPVRKAAVFCLVSLYMIIGESLREHLTNLSSSKVKLLNVYINRAKEAAPQQVLA